MIERTAAVASVVSAVGCGVVAGVLLAFSISVMPALRARPEHDGIGTMQQINLAIVAPVFLTVFFGSATASVIASIAAFASDNTSTMFPLVGAVTYLVGCVAVTIRVNVPLNNALAAVDPATAEARRLWFDYRTRWTRWNHVRVVAAVTSCVMFSLAA